MRDLNTLLISEMDQEEWTEFRKQWIDGYTQGLIAGNVPEELADDVADIRFEEYCGQEGYTQRDMEISDSRE